MNIKQPNLNELTTLREEVIYLDWRRNKSLSQEWKIGFGWRGRKKQLPCTSQLQSIYPNPQYLQMEFCDFLTWSWPSHCIHFAFETPDMLWSCINCSGRASFKCRLVKYLTWLQDIWPYYLHISRDNNWTYTGAQHGWKPRVQFV